MLRHILALGALVAATAPAVAQVDSGRASTLGYGISSREGWLGMGLACSQCSYRVARADTGRQALGRWSFSEPPSVFSVDAGGPADRAGLRAGDTLIAINGTPLTSQAGGAAFGSIQPGQEVRLSYRRDGREAQARLTAGSRPYRAETSRMLARQMEELQRAQMRRAEQMQRQVELAQRQFERQREYMARTIEALERARAQRLLSDSSRLESLRRYMWQLDSAAARWRGAESLYAPPPAAPAAPMPPAPPTAAAPALAPPPPPPTAYAWHRESGPLRYSGRLGDVIIEARGRGRVTATEVSDSEVVVTSGDVSVRLALRPHGPLKTAPRARPARPPED
jgi:hypothetical protein